MSAPFGPYLPAVDVHLPDGAERYEVVGAMTDAAVRLGWRTVTCESTNTEVTITVRRGPRPRP